MDQSPEFLQKKQAFEQKIALLCSQRIATVRYHDMITEGLTSWNYFGKRFDNPVYAVEFTFEDTGFLGITWGSDFTNWNLVPYDAPYETKGIINVTAISRWANYLHKTITSVMVYWDCWITGTPDKIEKEAWYPEELELVFEGAERIVISAAQVLSISNPDNMWRPGDEIIIVFDDFTAAKYKMGRYSPLVAEDPTTVSVICTQDEVSS